MTTSDPANASAPFTPAERDYIRRELSMFFSTLPTVAEGFTLKTWAGDPAAGPAPRCRRRRRAWSRAG